LNQSNFQTKQQKLYLCLRKTIHSKLLGSQSMNTMYEIVNSTNENVYLV